MSKKNFSPALKETAARLAKKSPRALFLCLFIPWAIGHLAALDWRFELWSHFKLQYLLGSLAFAMYFALRRQWRWLCAAILCASVSGFSVVPWYLPKASASVDKSPRRLRALLSNIFVDNRRYDQFLDFVRAENPDLLFVQEVTAPWADALGKIRDRYPYGAIRAAEDPGGLAALSRTPLIGLQEPWFEKDNLLGYELEMDLGGQTLHVLTAHPPPPVGKVNSETRNRFFSLLAERARSLSAPRIVIGDLNVTMWSPAYKGLISRADLVNAREGFGVIPTWPTIIPFMRIPIDHCLVSRDIRVTGVRAGPFVGSDHYPLIVDLEIPARQ
jgi:endonuclease/exonuclease/phosphatase (EEP) superfamily protein YafD